MLTKILGIFSALLMLTALGLIFLYAPTEATMGQVQRIFYFHVPQGILSYVSATLLGLGSILFLIKQDLKWDRFSECAAEMGILFTGTTLVSGMFWAKIAWGVYWDWDARLTLQLVLFLTLVAYFMLRAYLPNQQKRASLSCVFGFLAMLNIPFNYLSIYFLPTQHPQPVVSPGGGGVDPQMGIAFYVSLAAWLVLYAYLLRHRLAIAKVEGEVDYLEQMVHNA